MQSHPAQNNQTLQEIAENFHAFFEAVGDLIVIADTAGQILFSNEACQQRLGYSADELQQRQLLDLHPADARQEAAEIVAAMLRGERQTCPLPLVTQDGVVLPVETRVWLGRWNGADCLFGLMKDLTAEQEAQQRFERLFHNNPALMAVIQLPERRFGQVNQAFLDHLGYRCDEVIGQRPSDLDLFPNLDQQPALARLLDEGQPCANVELQVRCKGGVIRDGLFSGEWIRIQGKVSLLTVMIDITERKRAERALLDSEQRYRALNADLEHQVETRTAEIRVSNAALSASEERFRQLFEDSRQPIVVLQDDRIVNANLAAVALLRLDSVEQLIGRTPSEFSARVQTDGRASAGKATEMMRLAIERGNLDFEWNVVLADGETAQLQVLLTAMRRQGTPLIHAVLIDVTEQRRAQQRIDFLAYHDALTGLPNRLIGRDRLVHALAVADQQAHPLAVLFLDLDQFKYFNETHGQELGDALLSRIGQRLGEHLRAADVLCRIGGDEFMLVFTQLDAKAASLAVTAIVERILASLAKPFHVQGRSLYVSFCIGIALYPTDGAEAEVLMSNADVALAEAKGTGQGSFCFFEPRMNARLRHLVETRDALRQGLEQQAFVLHYQPQVDLVTGELRGVEALLRWQPTPDQLLMPDAFIGAAEESGLIVPIGRWVLMEACRQAAAWRAAGWPDLVMAVNLSAVQFRSERLASDVAQALSESGLAPDGLELELTESLLLSDDPSTQTLISEWKAQGIQLAIDDFGTGYSSLAYLKRLPVDKLKIDRSFICDLETDPENQVIVRAMIQIARTFNYKVLAEGVETVEVADRLMQMGCDQAQGYLYFKPLSAKDLVIG